VATEPVRLEEWRAQHPRARFASAGQSVNVGYYLRERIEEIARAEGRDATGLARSVLREYVEQRLRNGAAPR
jgi:hypothetical protein